MLRTAIPFGYLFIALILGAALVIGIAFLVFGLLRRRTGLICVGSVISLGIIGLVVYQLTFDAAMEWNPSIPDDAQVIGTWASDRETVTLRPDHTVDYRSDTEGFTGRWTREEWNLRLTADNVDSSMRFISFREDLRLMTNQPADPDMWDGDLGLSRR